MYDVYGYRTIVDIPIVVLVHIPRFFVFCLLFPASSSYLCSFRLFLFARNIDDETMCLLSRFSLSNKKKKKKNSSGKRREQNCLCQNRQKCIETHTHNTHEQRKRKQGSSIERFLVCTMIQCDEDDVQSNLI